MRNRYSRCKPSGRGDAPSLPDVAGDRTPRDVPCALSGCRLVMLIRFQDVVADLLASAMRGHPSSTALGSTRLLPVSQSDDAFRTRLPRFGFLLVRYFRTTRDSRMAFETMCRGKPFHSKRSSSWPLDFVRNPHHCSNNTRPCRACTHLAIDAPSQAAWPGLPGRSCLGRSPRQFGAGPPLQQVGAAVRTR